ncbi:phosphoserine transaminase [Cyphellophora europaea CBS 101466]|uniref:phosphoserine transaminase n=1 Tax=Cyphellophora europaea (strain CBS 101466) TaxID=1220924 RepID=W2RWY3_CYPE1|nr:phosphoserine transaminase [Cyphellophora europaea CBS 101466]ETN40927.1 phosphoserine transaminase [Cyphellophora europaea CBS 101466]
MPSRSEVAYFGAGPASLPTAALEQAAASLLNHENQGLGLGEISHRSPTANKVIADAKAALVHLLDIPDSYDIIFMQGGGSGEFSAVVQNLVSAWVERRRRNAVAELGEAKDEEVLQRVREELEAMRVEYLVTGSWSLKASQEAARLLGPKYVNVALDARKFREGSRFGAIPDEQKWAGNLVKQKGASALTYFCDNETVDGVEFPAFPKCLDGNEETEAGDERIVVADMSSNFLSRSVDVKKYSVIFGGAQKNLGLPGITLLIIRNSLLSLTPPVAFMHSLSAQLPNAIPPVVFDFATLAKNNSLYNTLPIFNLYVATLVLQDLDRNCGARRIAAQQEVAERKAARIYAVLDKYEWKNGEGVYGVVPEKGARSRMNVCFRVKGGDEAEEKRFVKEAEGRGLLGVKGHRSVGGIRVSNYNAVGEESVERLCGFLKEFAEGPKGA